MSLDIDPAEIKFDLSDQEPTSVLKIRNTSNEQVAFKVKTTMPKRYLVRPNQDVVDAGQTVDVRISLQNKEARQIRQNLLKDASMRDPTEYKDKFLIQSIDLKPEFKSQIEDARSSQKPMADILAGVWKETDKNELSSMRLKCTFIPPDPSLVDDQHSDVSNSHGGAAQDGKITDVEELNKLRRKYNELVNFTVQLTSERDRLKTAYKDLSKEIQMLKQQGYEGGLGDSVKGSNGKVSGDTTVIHASGGFSLWQVMLIAVLSFLAARLIGSGLAF